MRTVAAVVALVICVHAGLWALLQRQQAVANIDAPLASVSYSPYARSQHPDYGDRPTPEQIRADLKILSPYTQAIRTYSSTGGGELIPAIAAEFGLKVTLGIWIDKNEARNEREIQAAHRACAPLQQRQRDRGRQRGDVARRQVGRRAHLDHSARQAAKPGAGHHRRNLRRLARNYAIPTSRKMQPRKRKRQPSSPRRSTSSPPTSFPIGAGRRSTRRSSRPSSPTTGCGPGIPASAS